MQNLAVTLATGILQSSVSAAFSNLYAQYSRNFKVLQDSKIDLTLSKFGAGISIGQFLLEQVISLKVDNFFVRFLANTAISAAVVGAIAHSKKIIQLSNRDAAFILLFCSMTQFAFSLIRYGYEDLQKVIDAQSAEIKTSNMTKFQNEHIKKEEDNEEQGNEVDSKELKTLEALEKLIASAEGWEKALRELVQGDEDLSEKGIGELLELVKFKIGVLSTEIETKQSELNQLQSNFSLSEQNNKQLQAVVDENTTKMDQFTKEIEILKKENEKVTQVTNELKKLKKRHEELSKGKEQARESYRENLQKKDEEISTKDEEIKALKIQLEEKTSKVESTNSNSPTAVHSLKISNVNRSNSRNVNSSNSRLQSQDPLITIQDNSIKDLNRQIESLKKLNNTLVEQLQKKQKEITTLTEQQNQNKETK